MANHSLYYIVCWPVLSLIKTQCLFIDVHKIEWVWVHTAFWVKPTSHRSRIWMPMVHNEYEQIFMLLKLVLLRPIMHPTTVLWYHQSISIHIDCLKYLNKYGARFWMLNMWAANILFYLLWQVILMCNIVWSCHAKHVLSSDAGWKYLEFKIEWVMSSHTL